MSEKPVTTPFRWKGMNMHELLSRFHIHSITEQDELLDHASVQNDKSLQALSTILDEAYTMGYCRGRNDHGI